MIGGSGLPLPLPPTIVPLVPNAATPLIDNEFQLFQGTSVLVPPGVYLFWGSTTNVVAEYLDPVRQEWRPAGASSYGGNNGMTQLIWSDGTNFRIANLSGMPIGGVVTAAGSGYAQATTIITSSAGGSRWYPIIGGAVNSSVTIGVDPAGNTGGTNFSVTPLLVASAPSPPGIPCLLHCTISAGAINSVTVDVAGAGYTSPPIIQVIPNPWDPNLGLITIPVLTATLTGAGTLTGVLMTYSGTPQGSAPTLTVSGAGTAATATATMFNTTAATAVARLQLIGSAM